MSVVLPFIAPKYRLKPTTAPVRPPRPPPTPRATTRPGVIQHYRTSTPNQAPPAGELQEGELAIEMAPPRRLWVGVPPAIEASGRALLFDESRPPGLPEAPQDGEIYGRSLAAWVRVEVDPIDGGTF